MTTPKPASAPQADALHERVADFLSSIGWCASYDAQWTRLRDTLPELQALLAAQVREVDGLSRIDGMEFYLHENPDSTGNEEPVRLVMAMSVGDKVFCHRITQGDNGVCKPAAEPAPVAQIARFDFTEGGFEDENERGHYVRYADHVATIADHARREAELESQLVSARTRIGQLESACDGRFADYDRELKRANSLAASLAACRALMRRAWSLLDIECPNAPITDELQAALCQEAT